MTTAAAPSRPRRRLVLPGWMLGAYGFGLVLCIQQWRDPDVWWHLAVGRIILSSGIPSTEPFSFLHAPHPWIGQQWGFEVGLAKLDTWGGPGLVSALVGALAAAAFVVAVLSVPRAAAVPAVLRAAAAALSVLVAAQVLGVRGQVITVLGTAVTLWLLSCWRAGAPRMIWWLVPLVVVWANLHAGFITGLALCVVVAGATLAVRWAGSDAGAGDVRALLGATAMAALASAVNPAGVHLWPYIAQTFANPTLTQNITEWSPPDFHNNFLRLFELQAMLLAACWIWSRRPHPVDVIVAVAFFAATLQAQRNVALFAVIAAPQLAEYGAMALRRRPLRALRALTARVDSMALPIGIVVVLSALYVSVPSTSGSAALTAQRSLAPVAAADYIAAPLHGLAGRHVYSTYEWGGYLAYRFPTQRVVYVYGESAVLGSGILQQYLDIHTVHGNWRERLTQDAMVVAVVPAVSQEWSIFSEIGWSTACYDPDSGAAVMRQGMPPAGAVGWSPSPATSAPRCA